MKKSMLALTAVAAFSGTAMAADMAVKAPVYNAPVPAAVYNWTGFYIGGNAGYAWGSSNTSNVFTCPAGDTCGYFSPSNFAAFNAAGTGSLNPAGFTGGAQAGYNWQNGALVAGVEADINAFKLKQTRALGGIVPVGFGQNFLVTTAVNSDWLFTARGRLGWAVTPTTLLYATGGLALTDLKVSNAFADTFVPFETGASSQTVTKVGWTVGAGTEWALAANWSVKAEYLYVNFGPISTGALPNFVGNANANLMVTSADLKAQIARVGVNYKFGAPVVAKY